MLPARYTPDKGSDLLDEAIEEVQEVLSEIKEIQEIQVYAVKNIRHLGKYVHGTKRKPTILVSLRACKRASDMYGADPYDAILTTILHELAHAIQEVKGLPFDEEQAEEFAHSYWETGELIRIS